jgi:hypothetical protein
MNALGLKITCIRSGQACGTRAGAYIGDVGGEGRSLEPCVHGRVRRLGLHAWQVRRWECRLRNSDDRDEHRRC